MRILDLKNNTIHPIKKDVKARIKNIFRLENPITLILSKSLLFLMSIINFILVIKIIKVIIEPIYLTKRTVNNKVQKLKH